MGKLNVNEMISKAISGDTLPQSILNTQQADKFIDLVVDYSVLLKNVRKKRIDHPSGEINKLDLANPVTEGASSTTNATTHEPQESVVPYNTVKYRSAFDLVTDFVEDNLEGSSIQDTLMNMFTKRIAVDTELAAIQGDESITTGDGESQIANLLGANDGWDKLLLAATPAGQIVDAAGTASSRRLFHDMKRKIPARYRVAQPDYRWISPSSVYDKWELDEGERVTETGDTVRQTGAVRRNPGGIRMFESLLSPEDLSYGTAVSDASRIWLTPYNNLIWFMQRDITIEWDRVPRKDLWEVTIHFRQDVAVENGALAVIGNNVSESGSDYAG